ncbi:MAG: HD domain-containing protein [Marinilabilia sp.]
MPQTDRDLSIRIIEKYYPSDHPARDLLITHSRLVRDKSLDIATRHPELKADHNFIYEAAMLHDIGISRTNAPVIGCFGDYPYICHGYLGREILEQEGLPQHALVCERHTGTGLTATEIRQQQLPLPHRDMVPLSIEEQIICFADTFFSKGHDVEKEKTPEEVKKILSKYGEEKVTKFTSWCQQFL